MSSKKDVAKNKNTKPSIENPSGLYEFANDQLGENRDPAFKDLGAKANNKNMPGKKK
ncbi:hypothetical protein [Acetivibrio cellulolyticus]|uniref:hypothetical protein n=1 Tax=Acetivibrio cellulolyticus TaxID=35830 RepID=UPI0001E2FB16|nr:hypothetical protein [Acetivibrio cellulolyticus]